MSRPPLTSFTRGMGYDPSGSPPSGRSLPGSDRSSSLRRPVGSPSGMGSLHSRPSISPSPDLHLDGSHPPYRPSLHGSGGPSSRHGADEKENLNVVVRVRPPVPRELNGYRPYVDVVQLSSAAPHSITLCDALETEDGEGAVYSRQTFAFDCVYGKETTQEDLYEWSARPAVRSVLEGYNATLMAYGQTGTGKTFTMEGFTSVTQRGIIPRAVEDVFAYIEAHRHPAGAATTSSSASGATSFLVRASYMQIYNEIISDLLDPPPPPSPSTAFSAAASTHATKSLQVRHTPQRGVYVDGLSEWVVRTPDDVYELIARGTALRATSSTKLSELSSRSHAIFTLVVEAMQESASGDGHAYRYGKLHIVDLAGSEKIHLAGVTGQRLEETKNINKSLHELGNVISALAAQSTKKSGGSGAPKHIPFRNSALTSALRDSLGGNCKTTIIACISPALESYAESLSTLVFANRAKNIQTHAVLNAGMDQASLLRTYEQELKKLRQQLQERSGAGGASATSVSLSEMEEDRRRAEADREAALRALRQSSQAYQEEQRIRHELEHRIQELESVMAQGGLDGVPRTSAEYESRLMEMDHERQAAAEDKEQMDRYKQLLLKQRDIMLSLTTRLNDRDEAILLLQEEVDAYDEHVQRLEEQLEGQQGGGGGGWMTLPQAKAMVEGARRSEQPGHYTSLYDPSVSVGAEEFMIQVLTQHGAALPPTLAPAAPPPPERAEMEATLQRRAECLVQQQFAERCATAQEKIDAMALQLHEAEDRAAAMEQALAQRGASFSPGELATLVKQELESRRRLYANTLDAMQDAKQQARDERRHLAREVDRLRFEVEQLLEDVRYTPSQRAEASRLWQRLQTVEEGVLYSTEITKLLSRAAKGGRPSSPSASSSATTMVAALEGQLRAKEREIEQLQQSSTTSAGPDAPDVAALQKKVNTFEKDHKALRTILEQRMKVKIDRVCAALDKGGDAAGAVQEARSLQTLIEASIRAMDT